MTAARIASPTATETSWSPPTGDYIRDEAEEGNLAMDDDKLIDEQHVDAVQLSDTVFRLMFPGRTAPGRMHADRDDAYAANLAVIRCGFGTDIWAL